MDGAVTVLGLPAVSQRARRRLPQRTARGAIDRARTRATSRSAPGLVAARPPPHGSEWVRARSLFRGAATRHGQGKHAYAPKPRPQGVWRAGAVRLRYAASPRG